MPHRVYATEIHSWQSYLLFCTHKRKNLSHKLYLAKVYKPYFSKTLCIYPDRVAETLLSVIVLRCIWNLGQNFGCIGSYPFADRIGDRINYSWHSHFKTSYSESFTPTVHLSLSKILQDTEDERQALSLTFLKTLVLSWRKIKQSKQSFKMPIRLEISTPTSITKIFCLEQLTHPHKLWEQLFPLFQYQILQTKATS